MTQKVSWALLKAFHWSLETITHCGRSWDRVGANHKETVVSVLAATRRSCDTALAFKVLQQAAG